MLTETSGRGPNPNERQITKKIWYVLNEEFVPFDTLLNFYKKSLRWRVDNKNQHPELGTSAKITVLKFARFLIKINSSWTMFV